MIARARSLRSNLTDVEKKLWWHLRRKNIHEVKFRKQAPIGRYIVDFACYDPKLINYPQQSWGVECEPLKAVLNEGYGISVI